MTRNTLFLIIMAFFVGIFTWLYKTKSSLFTNLEEVRPKTQTTSTSLPRLSGSSTKSPSSAQLGTLEDLRNQLRDEETKLDVLDQKISDLQEQRAQQQNRAAISSPSQIQETQIHIQNLTDSLQDQRLAENEINQAADAALTEQSSVDRFARDQIDHAILVQEENIQRLEQQLNAVQLGGSYVISERQAQIQDLQNQLAAQTQELDDLRAEKLENSANLLQQTRRINSTAQQQKQDLVNEEDNVQNEIVALRERNRQLQTLRTDSRMSLMSLDQQLQQAQKDYELEDQKVSELEKLIEDREKELSQ